MIDLLDGDLYAGDPYPTYAWMREHAPVYWDATNELWGISRYDDIVEIEKAKDVFINSDRTKGGYRPEPPVRPVDHRPRRPAAHEAPQAGEPRLHAAHGAARGRTTSSATVTGLLDAATRQGPRRAHRRSRRHRCRRR